MLRNRSWFAVLAVILVFLSSGPAGALSASDGAWPSADANGDDETDIGDPILILSHLFCCTPPPACPDLADADGSGGRVTMTDAIYILNWLFLSGPPPAGWAECSRSGGCEGREWTAGCPGHWSCVCGKCTPACDSSDFDTGVLQVFRRSCIECHGGFTAEGCFGYRDVCLGSYEAVRRSVIDVPGKSLIIPGDSATSLLMYFITTEEGARMPRDGPPYLPREEIDAIRKWIDDGAAPSPTQGNRPPVVSAGGPYASRAGVTIAFAAEDPYDLDGDPLTLAWDFGDGTTGEGRFPWHAYATGGTFTVTVTASDGQAESRATAQVTVAAGGAIPTDFAVERACSRCHGLRIALDDGRHGAASPAGQGIAIFPKGVVLEARGRTPAAWRATTARMVAYGGPFPFMSEEERAAIEEFLLTNYASADARTEVFIRICGGCHTPALSLALPRPLAVWRTTIDRVVVRYKAAMTEGERDSVTSYLAEAAAGPQPAALESGMARMLLQRVCVTCHPPVRFMDESTSLPRARLRTFEGARSTVTVMIGRGGGQPGVSERPIARWLSEMGTTVPGSSPPEIEPDLVCIVWYNYEPIAGGLVVRAESSRNQGRTMVLMAEDGRTFNLPPREFWGYYLESSDVHPPPGRIWLRTDLKGLVGWHKEMPGE
jgi:mono/diheme cytochrome c family protein